MDLRPRKLETVKEEGWYIVSNAWWHTPFESVPWTYSQEDAVENKSRNRWFQGSLFSASRTPCDTTRPHPRGDLVLSMDLSGVRCAIDALVKYERDVGFSPVPSSSRRPVDISVAVDEEAVSQGKERWETFAEVLTSGVVPVINEDTAFQTIHREPEAYRTSSPSSSHGGLHRSTSTLSSVDLTDSDLSFKSSSPPSTPTRKSAESMVEVKEPSPEKVDHGYYIFSPSRPLNASASSFVPSSTSLKAGTEPFSFMTPVAKPRQPPPPALVDFAFPTSETLPLQTVQIKKDEHGFYSQAEVAAPVPQSRGEACAFLPPFLQNSSRRKAPASKTRAMVDRLRSSHNHSHSPSPNPPLYDISILDERISVSEDDRAQNSGISSPSSQEDDEDGWINLAETDKSSKESKARRTRDLFLALTRRRSDSVPPQKEDVAKDEHREIEFPMTMSPSSSPSLPSLDDGWIDGSSLLTATDVTPQRQAESRSRSHRKRRSSHATLAPPHALPSHYPPSNIRASAGATRQTFPSSTSIYPSSNPTPYFYSAYPTIMSPVAYTSYMQQLQLMQLQMRSGGGGNARRTTALTSTEWFQYPTAGATFTTVNTPASMAASPTPVARRDSLW